MVAYKPSAQWHEFWFGTGAQQAALASPPARSVELSTLAHTWLNEVAVKDRQAFFNQSLLFSFVHISKVGGATFIDWAHGPTGKLLFPQFYPSKTSGIEHGLLYDVAQRPAAQRLVLLRSPRAHLLSMFKECRYSSWGSSLLKKNWSVVPHHSTHQHDFEQWIGYYQHPTAGGREWMGCYEPWNYQARAMTSKQNRPHNVLERGGDYVPSLDAAMASYVQADWVGLTDFFNESLCLLLSRLRSEVAEKQLSQSCRCDHAATVPFLDVPIIRHGKVSSSNVSISPVLAAQMDRLTMVDNALFSVALRGFFGEIKDLEARLGRRVICPHVLKKAEPKLIYVANVTALYIASR